MALGLFINSLLLSMLLVSRARHESHTVGVVYAIWAGMGILAASILGLVVFDERLGPLQYFFIAMILVAAVGLNLTTTHDLKT